jgi:putative DNA primase/helicase
MPQIAEEIQIGDFLLNEEGVFYIDQRGEHAEEIHVCSPLTINAVTRNADGNDWGKRCSFLDPEGNEKQHHFRSASLMGNAQTVVSEFVHKGLILSGNPRSRTLLVQYLRSTRSDSSMLSSTKPGWVRESFVVPDASFGSEEVVYSGDYRGHGISVCGNWKANVGKYCSGNSRLILAASTAFAAPLLAVAEMDGGGFHIRGESSTGKSTALEVAASVYGSPNNYMLNWDATKNSMEEVAEAHNDCLMVIDELGVVDGTVVGDTIYMLANGHGKARMGREKRRFRVLTLTSGEISLAEQMAKAGKETMKGQEVRLLDIAADAGANMGLFEELHSFGKPADLANHLKAATSKHYGRPLQDFLHIITSKRHEVEIETRRIIGEFAALVTPKNANGQVSRAIRRFGLAAAAGEIATANGLTGWKKGEAIEGARKCFSAWMEYRKSFDTVAMAVDLVKMFVLEHEAQFEVDGGAPVEHRVGFRKDSTFFILPEIFRDVVCDGKQPELVAQALEESGFLNTSGKNRLQKQVRIAGKPMWGFSIKDTIRVAA